MTDFYVSPTVKLELGDNVYIGPGVRIIGTGVVRFGDYSKIHQGCFINSADKHIIFGHNTWIGERTVLDGTGGITAGNNVGVGIASHLYSHIAHGDVMAGCRYMSSKELVVGDDAWFVGQCLVSPVTVGSKSLAMLGSTITKDMLPNHTYAGVPAVDITHKVGAPWKDVTPGEKLRMFSEHLLEFAKQSTNHASYATKIEPVAEFPTQMSLQKSYFNVVSRTYTKRRTVAEIEFMKWFTTWRGRFTPEVA